MGDIRCSDIPIHLQVDPNWAQFFPPFSQEIRDASVTAGMAKAERIPSFS